MNIGEHGGEKNNAVNPVLTEKVEIFYLLIAVVGGVHKKYLIAVLIQHLTYALGYPCAAFAGELWDNNAHKLRYPCFYRLSGYAWGVSRFFNGFLYFFTLVIAEISVIEISAHCRF